MNYKFKYTDSTYSFENYEEPKSNICLEVCSRKESFYIKIMFNIITINFTKLNKISFVAEIVIIKEFKVSLCLNDIEDELFLSEYRCLQ